MTARRRHPTAAMALGVPLLAAWFLLAQWALGAGTAVVILACVVTTSAVLLAVIAAVRHGSRP